jgi:molybdopterin synthase catalytic subunit
MAIRTALSNGPLDPASLIAEVSDPTCGAIASFVGTVRSSASAAGHDADDVVRLEYEAHADLATTRLDEIAAEAVDRWGLQNVVAVHRVGVCDLGEPTVVVACAAPHRAEALAACHWTIDEIKRSTPIWKKEVFADGTSWVEAEGSSDSA